MKKSELKKIIRECILEGTAPRFKGFGRQTQLLNADELSKSDIKDAIAKCEDKISSAKQTAKNKKKSYTGSSSNPTQKELDLINQMEWRIRKLNEL